jgi:hypothetical protein
MDVVKIILDFVNDRDLLQCELVSPQWAAASVKARAWWKLLDDKQGRRLFLFSLRWPPSLCDLAPFACGIGWLCYEQVVGMV